MEKLTLELGDIGDLIKEANFYAGLEPSDFIKREHVEKAVGKRIFRSNLLEERIRELVEKDIFWVETDGAKVGQINGLSILWTGDHEFGKPNRTLAGFMKEGRYRGGRAGFGDSWCPASSLRRRFTVLLHRRRKLAG